MPKGLNELNSASSLDGSELLLVQQSSDDMKVTINQIKDLVLDSVFPVGSIYTQFPNQLDPAGLNYPGTWSNVSSSYAGDFFRVEGGNAVSFEGGEQTDEIKSHTHTQYTGTVDDKNFSSSNGQYPPGDGPGVNDTGLTVSTVGGVETRPINQTIRIWKRTT